MKNLKISIIMPIYNVEKYIKQTLNSVLNQTLQEFEIILIDDKSTDKTIDIINSFNDPRIRLFRNKKNIKYGKSCNYGIRHASGEYLFFLGGDDLIYKTNSLEHLWHGAVANNSVICGGNILLFNGDDVQNPYYWNAVPKFSKNKLSDFEKSYDYCAGYTRFIYKRDFIIKNEIFFPMYPRRQDPIFFIKAMGFSKGKYMMIKDDVYLYRIMHKEIEWDFDKLKGVLESFRDCFKMYKQFGFFNIYKKDVQDLQNYLPFILRLPKPEQNKLEELYKFIFNMIPAKYSKIGMSYPNWLTRFICGFIPSKKWRREFRKKHTTKSISKPLA